MSHTANTITPELSQDQRERFHEHGYVIVDDFLPNDLHQRLLFEFRNRPAQVHYQMRGGHYSHVFESEFETLPKPNEPYLAKFSLLAEPREISGLDDAFQGYIAPMLKQATDGAARFALYPGAVRLRSGDVYRAHQDAYAGLVGYTYFLNEGWCWDYGGILTYVRDSFEGEPVYPRSNRLLLRDERRRQFHFLNTIEQHCDKEQYLILGWADSKRGNNSQVRGTYEEF
jgi:hypothetical protein